MMELKTKQRLIWAGLLLYIFVLIEVILVKHPRYFYWRMVQTFYRRNYHVDHKRGNFQPFHTLRYQLFEDFHLIETTVNILGNIVLFVPMGMILPMFLKGKRVVATTVILSFCVSLAFEVFQYITACGFFDVDDLILNTLGGFIGVMGYQYFTNRIFNIRNKSIVPEQHFGRTSLNQLS